MARNKLDQIEIRAFGQFTEVEEFTSPIDIRGTDGVNVLVDYLGGDAPAIYLRPYFSFNQMAFDSNGSEIDVSASNQEWFANTIGVWDDTEKHTKSNVDEIYIESPPTGILEKIIVSLDVPGASAMRLGFAAAGTITGPDSGSVGIKASRVGITYDPNRHF